MSEYEPHDAFGTGLRAYLGRHAAEEAAPSEPQPAVPAGAQPSERPPAPLTDEELAQRTRELAERERRFGEHVQAFDRHVAAMRRHEEELREREEALAAREARVSTERRDVREALRDHAEGSLARIFQVFDEALAAEEPGGGADHGVRLATVRALLAEAYAQDGNGATAAAVDELAQIRERRAGS
jgi:hypothetical protein